MAFVFSNSTVLIMFCKYCRNKANYASSG